MRKAVVGLALAVSSVVVVAAAIATIAMWDESGPSPDAPPGDDVVEQWMDRLRTGDVVGRCRAVRGLAASDVNCERSSAFLVRAAADPADGVRFYLVVGSEDRPDWIVEATRASFAALARDRDEVISRRATQSLRSAAKRGNDVALSLLRDLAQRTRRNIALLAIAESGRATADDVATIVAALNDEDDLARSAAARAVGVLGTRAGSCAGRLADMISSGPAALSAGESLSKVAPDYGHDRKIVVAITSGIAAQNDVVRKMCCRLLRRADTPNDGATSRLDAVATSDPSTEVRVAAIVTLAILRRDATNAAERLEAIRTREGRRLAIYVDDEIRWTGETDPTALELERRFWDERER